MKMGSLSQGDIKVCVALAGSLLTAITLVVIAGGICFQSAFPCLVCVCVCVCELGIASVCKVLFHERSLEAVLRRIMLAYQRGGEREKEGGGEGRREGEREGRRERERDVD